MGEYVAMRLSLIENVLRLAKKHKVPLSGEFRRFDNRGVKFGVKFSCGHTSYITKQVLDKKIKCKEFKHCSVCAKKVSGKLHARKKGEYKNPLRSYEKYRSAGTAIIGRRSRWVYKYKKYKQELEIKCICGEVFYKIAENVKRKGAGTLCDPCSKIQCKNDYGEFLPVRSAIIQVEKEIKNAKK